MRRNERKEKKNKKEEGRECIIKRSYIISGDQEFSHGRERI
jgi:hypothetical protein